MRVFIAEGLGPVRERLTELVREQTEMVLVAQSDSGGDLSSRLKSTRPGLLILGTSLVDGSPFLALEKALAEWSDMCVVMLCEQLNGQYLYNARKKGADYVLESPRDIEMLPTLFRQLVRSRTGCRHKQAG